MYCSVPPIRALAGCIAAGLLSGSLARAQQAAPMPVHPGIVEASQKISSLQGNFPGPLLDGDVFGSGVANVGDLDQDGIFDIAVGAIGDDDGGTDRGAVWVLFLAGDGTVESSQKISDLQGGFGGVLHDGDAFGCGLAAGDLDGDGIADLAVGAGGDDDGGSNRGAVWIVFLNANGTVKAEQKISATQGGFGGTLHNNDQFGASVAFAGDVNGDQIQDIAVGTPGDDDGGSNRGATWVVFLNLDGTVKGQQKISDTQGGFTGILHNLDRFGGSVTGLGDFDGDQVADLAVGAIGDDDGGPGRGAVWLLFLNASGTVKGHQKISSTQGGFPAGLCDGDNFGTSLAAAQLDAGGVIDLVVGAAGDDDGGPNRGAVWVVFLNADGTVFLPKKISSLEGGFLGNLADLDEFGTSVAVLPGVSGNGVANLMDGAPDLVVGAAGDDDGGSLHGAVWNLFLGGGSVDEFNGSGINPVGLFPGNNPPRIGTIWDPFIQLPPAPLGIPLKHFLILSDEDIVAAATPVAGINIFGEFLVNLAPPHLLQVATTNPGTHFAISIPLDVTLVGVEFFAQGAQLEDTNDIILTNGLDVVIGL